MSVISNSAVIIGDLPELSFESGSSNWKVAKNPDDKLVSSYNDVDMFRVSNDLGVWSTKFTVDTVTLEPSTSSQTWTLQLPAAAPSGYNKSFSYTNGSFVWQDIFPKTNNTILVKPNPIPNAEGEFGSIYSAVNSISDASSTNPYVVLVYPGRYTEPATIVLSPYIYVTGRSLEPTIVSPAGDFPLFELTERTGLSFMLIRDGGATSPIISIVDTGDYAVMHKVEIENCPKGIYCQSTSTDSLIYLEYVSFSDSTDYALWIEDNDSGFYCEVSIENFFVYGHSDTAIYVHGDNSHLINNSATLQSDGTGIGVYAQKATQITMRSTYIQGYTTGIKVDTLGTAPELICSGIFFHDCTKNIQILNTTTTGYYVGYSDYTKTEIASEASFFISNKDTRVITVGKRGTDFLSVKAAVDSITDASSTNRYEIQVGPGIFTEDPFTLPSYVGLAGRNPIITILQANNPNANFITMSGRTYINSLLIRGPTSGASIYYPGNSFGYHIRLTGLLFGSAQTLVKVRDTSGPFNIMATYINIDQNATFTTGFDIHDTANNGGAYIFNNTIWGPLTNSNQTIYLLQSDYTGAGYKHFGYIPTNYIGNATVTPNGKGIQIDGQCKITITGSVFGGFDTCLLNDNTISYAPNLIINSSVFLNNNTDVSLTNPAISGSVELNASRQKISIVGDVAVNINDTGDIIMSGELYQGSNWSNITNMTKMIQKNGLLGGLSGGALSQTDVLEVTVSPGYGYLDLSSSCKFVEWASTVLTLLTNELYYIYVNNSGTVLASTSSPSAKTNLLLGYAQTSSDIILLGKTAANEAYHLNTFSEAYDLVIGTKIYNGCLITPGSGTRTLNMSSGTYYTSTTKFTPSAKTDISMNLLSSAGYISTSVSVLQSYDLSGVTTALGAAEWAKHLLYMQDDGTNQSYALVLSQQKYTSYANALAGSLPVLGMLPIYVRLAAIIVSGSDTTIASNQIVDLRPLPDTSITALNSTSDHNLLQNLATGDPHTQYLPSSGARPMTGNLNLNSNNITNATLINGISITAHASRHLPNGADPLTTATPVTIGTANSTGVANSFSRSDHTHNHGNQTDQSLHAAVTSSTHGFMIASDKAKLDASTSGVVRNTLVERDELGATSLSALNLVIDKFVITLQPDPTTAESKIYYLPPKDGSNGEVLQTNGAGELTWVTPSSGFSDPTTTRGDLIYRDSTNTTTRLPLGTQRQKICSFDGDVTWTSEYIPARETLFWDDFRGSATPFADMPVWTTTVSGAGAAISNGAVAVTGNYNGITQLSTGTTATGRTFLTSLNQFIPSWGTFTSEFSAFLTDIPVAQNYTVYLGFGNTTTAEPTSGLYFTITNGTNWIARTANGGTRTSTTTSVAFTLNRWWRFRIQYTSPNALYYINDTLVAIISTNIPTTRIGPTIGIIKSIGTTAFPLTCDYFSYMFYYTTTRY